MTYSAKKTQGLGLLVLLFALAEAVAAQVSHPEFEAASVRQTTASGRMSMGGVRKGGPGSSDPGRIVYEAVPLVRLLLDAYEIDADQLSGPGWATTFGGADTRYDVQAVLPAGADARQIAEMLRNLLIERFHIVVHRQQRQSAGYALVAARSGPLLSPSRGPVSAADRGVAGPGGEYKLDTPATDAFPPLFPWAKFGASTRDGVIRMRFRDFAMPELASHLSFILAARVVDDTSLRSSYDFTFKFAPPERGMAEVRAIAGAPRDRHLMYINAPDESQLACVPTLSSALEKQLGLKLEARRVPVDVLVIDHANKTPDEN